MLENRQRFLAIGVGTVLKLALPSVSKLFAGPTRRSKKVQLEPRQAVNEEEDGESDDDDSDSQAVLGSILGGTTTEGVSTSITVSFSTRPSSQHPLPSPTDPPESTPPPTTVIISSSVVSSSTSTLGGLDKLTSFVGPPKPPATTTFISSSSFSPSSSLSPSSSRRSPKATTFFSSYTSSSASSTISNSSSPLSSVRSSFISTSQTTLKVSATTTISPTSSHASPSTLSQTSRNTITTSLDAITASPGLQFVSASPDLREPPSTTKRHLSVGDIALVESIGFSVVALFIAWTFFRRYKLRKSKKFDQRLIAPPTGFEWSGRTEMGELSRTSTRATWDENLRDGDEK